MIRWSIPIALRIPICLRLLTVLMKITTIAMIRLTKVEIVLMMLKLVTASPVPVDGQCGSSTHPIHLMLFYGMHRSVIGDLASLSHRASAAR